MFVYPTLIAPLFNKFVALDNGPLKKRIEALAQNLKYALHDWRRRRDCFCWPSSLCAVDHFPVTQEIWSVSL